MPKTPTVALAEQLLGEHLEDWIKPRRTGGDSWNRLARDLERATNGKCVVTDELLRRHFGHIPRK